VSSYARWMVGAFGSSGGGARSGARRTGSAAHDRDLASEQSLLLDVIAVLVDAVAAYGSRGECQYLSVRGRLSDAVCVALSRAMQTMARSVGSPSSGTPASPSSERGHIDPVVRDVSTAAGHYRLRGIRLRPGLFDCARSVLVIADRLAGDAIDRARMRELFRLTEREVEVALLLAERRRNAEIARALGISVHTARHHIERVLGKLGDCKRGDVQRVLRSGLERRGSD
jgi:DNA-binding CsgD family transcriptional regulator